MKYFIRLLAALPMLGAGTSVIVFCVMAFALSPIWVLAAIANVYSFIACAAHYEDTVRYLAVFFKRMSEDALC
jgi:hypothetical protein